VTNIEQKLREWLDKNAEREQFGFLWIDEDDIPDLAAHLSEFVSVTEICGMIQLKIDNLQSTTDRIDALEIDAEITLNANEQTLAALRNLIDDIRALTGGEHA